MFGCVVVESDDFAEKTTAANVSSHMTLTLAGTKKYITYNLNKQLRAISVLEESELLANSAKAQRFATNTILVLCCLVQVYCLLWRCYLSVSIYPKKPNQNI